MLALQQEAVGLGFMGGAHMPVPGGLPPPIPTNAPTTSAALGALILCLWRGAQGRAGGGGIGGAAWGLRGGRPLGTGMWVPLMNPSPTASCCSTSTNPSRSLHSAINL